MGLATDGEYWHQWITAVHHAVLAASDGQRQPADSSDEPPTLVLPMAGHQGEKDTLLDDYRHFVCLVPDRCLVPELC